MVHEVYSMYVFLKKKTFVIYNNQCHQNQKNEFTVTSRCHLCANTNRRGAETLRNGRMRRNVPVSVHGERLVSGKKGVKVESNQGYLPGICPMILNDHSVLLSLHVRESMEAARTSRYYFYHS